MVSSPALISIAEASQSIIHHSTLTSAYHAIYIHATQDILLHSYTLIIGAFSSVV